MEIRQKKQKSGKIAFFLDWRDPDTGIRHRPILKGIKNYKDAVIAANEWEKAQERTARGLSKNPKISLAALMQRLIKHKKTFQVSAKWLDVMAQHLSYMNAWQPEIQYQLLSTDRLGEYRDHLIEKGLAAETINKSLKMIKASGALAVEDGLIPKLPFRSKDGIAFALNESTQAKSTVIEQENLATILRVARDGETFETAKRAIGKASQKITKTHHRKPNARLYRAVLFLSQTGCRAGQMQSLTWGDLDFKTGMVTFFKTKKQRSAKGGRVEEYGVPLNDELIAVLKEMKRGQAQTDKVFGRYLNLLRDFRKICTAHSLPRYRIHDLRHTFCTRLLEAGVGILTVSHLAGHSDCRMLSERYGHIVDSSKRDAIASLSGATIHSIQPQEAATA